MANFRQSLAFSTREYVSNSGNWMFQHTDCQVHQSLPEFADDDSSKPGCVQEALQSGAQVLMRSKNTDPPALSDERWQGLGSSDSGIRSFEHNGDFSVLVGDICGNAVLCQLISRNDGASNILLGRLSTSDHYNMTRFLVCDRFCHCQDFGQLFAEFR
jgi:hypothetical protein